MFPRWLTWRWASWNSQNVWWLVLGFMVADPPYHSYDWFPSRRWFQNNRISFVQFPAGFEGLCGVPPWWGQKRYKMNTFTNRLLKGKIWRWFSKSKVFIIILALCFVWIWWGHFGVGVSKMGRPRKKKSNSPLLGWIGMGLNPLNPPPYPSYKWFPHGHAFKNMR